MYEENCKNSNLLITTKNKIDLVKKPMGEKYFWSSKY